MYSFSSSGKPGSDRPSATSTSKVSAFARRYASDKRGTIAILFAMMLTAVVSVVGGAVDYARWLSAKTRPSAPWTPPSSPAAAPF